MEIPAPDTRAPFRLGRALLAVLATLVCALFACATSPTASAPPPLAELVEPDPKIEGRDLFYGVGGRALAPPADLEFQFLERDESGTHTNFEVKDSNGREWDAKFGDDETKPEVVASRLLWAVGFHQPPIYYVREWKISNGPEAGPQPEARFRLERPEWKKDGEWEWQDNPFVRTRELRGLIVLMVMINNWDLKTSNNKIYERRGAVPSRIYVAKDLGSSFGRTVRIFLGSQGDIGEFTREGFIRDVDGDRVYFHYEPVILNWGVTRGITVDDVLWTCRRLDRLSDRQWRDAFRAGGYTDAEGAAFIARLKQKVREGLALAKGAQS